jgi:aryl-alcohol dehydrogenase-like predicted oxidoreductase
MELGLGTVQFGLDYGVSNTQGKVSLSEAAAILREANMLGIRVLDTASAYGESEEVIGIAASEGHSFRIVTKLPALKKDRITAGDTDTLKRAFEASLQRLKAERTAGLLLHSAGDLLAQGGEKVYELLRSLRDGGAAEKIGISVYTGDEIDRVCGRYDIDLVQAPVNVLDRRLIRSGRLEFLKSRGIEIHVRSAFLQGLLLMHPDSINPYFSPIEPTLRRYREMLDAKGLTPTEGALGFLRTVREIDVVLVGVTCVRELRENAAAFSKGIPPLADYSPFAVDDAAMIDPRQWKM